MHYPRILTLSAVVVTVGCGPTDERSTPIPSAPQFAHQQDLEGTPDLIVDGARVASSWVIYDENLTAGLCSVEEGEVTPGLRRLLRFTVTAPNIGDADVF